MRIFSSFLLFSFTHFVWAGDITLLEVVDRLTYHHGPEWKSLVKSQSDQSQVRGHLQSIIAKKVNYNNDQFKDYKAWAPHIYETAVGEIGNFSSVDGSNGKATLEQLKKLHQKHLNSASKTNGVDPYLISLYQSISYIGTPEAVNYLTEQMGKSEMYDYSLAEMINNNFLGSENQELAKTDFDPSLRYTPNIEKSYIDRPGDWKSTIKKFRLKLASYRNSPNAPNSLKQFIRKVNFKTSEIVANANKSLNKTSAASKKSLRAVASIDDNDDGEGHPGPNNRGPSSQIMTSEEKEKNWKLFFIVLGVTALFLIKLFTPRRK